MKSATPPLRKRCFWLPKGTQIEPFWVHFGKEGFKKQASMFDMVSEEHFLYFFIVLESKWRPKRPPKRHQNAPKLTREPFGGRFCENDVPARGQAGPTARRLTSSCTRARRAAPAGVQPGSRRIVASGKERSNIYVSEYGGKRLSGAAKRQ